LSRRAFDTRRNTVTQHRHTAIRLVDALPGKQIAIRIAIMVKITIQNQNNGIHILVEGKLINGWIDELERCWLENAALCNSIYIEFVNIPFIEPEAKILLAKMAAHGVNLSAREIHMKAVLKEISRERL